MQGHGFEPAACEQVSGLWLEFHTHNKHLPRFSFCRHFNIYCFLFSKLSSVFESTAFVASGEVRPIQSSKSFVTAFALIAMVVFARESHLTPREKVGSLLHVFDSVGLYVKWAAPVFVGKQSEEVLWEIFQNYCSSLYKKKRRVWCVPN